MRLRLLFAFILTTMLLCHSGWAQDSTPSDQTAQDTITVIASGTGIDEKAALKQAFSNAITQAIGTIVDAETVVKNDQIITDQILTASNAIISKYDPIGQPSVDQGFVTVKIKAVVERKQLTDLLTQTNVISKPVEGKDLFAQIVTELQNEKDAAVIMRRAFEGFPANVIRAEPIGEPKIIKRDDDGATITVTVRYSIDSERYGQWIKSFMPFLQRVALRTDDTWWNPANPGVKMLQPNSPWVREKQYGMVIPEDVRRQAMAVRDDLGRTVQDGFRVGGWSNRQCIVVFEHQGGTKVHYMEFAPSAFRCAVEAAMRVPVANVVLKAADGSDIAGVKNPAVSHKDDFGQALRVTPFWVFASARNNDEMEPAICSNVLDLNWTITNWIDMHFRRQKHSLLVFPYFGSYRCAAPCLDQQLPFTLTLDELQRVKSVEAAVTQQAYELPKQWTLEPDQR